MLCFRPQRDTFSFGMIFFDEIRRRNVHRVALGYLAGAWLLIQIADTVFPRIGLSETAITGVIVLLAIGFLPALILAWVFEWTPEGFRRERDFSAAAPRHSTRGLDRAITVMLILAVGYFAVDKFVLDPARDAAEIKVATEEALKKASIESFGDRSIIVLPFLNMSPDPDQAYFADGMTEELLNVLAGISELRVISRSTAWTFKGKEIDIDAVQKKLDVSHVLEGSVRKAGNTIRVTAQLIDARTNKHIWSEAYDREFEDIFKIQDEISAHIVEELKLELLEGAPRVIEIDPRAYELFLQARFVTSGFLQDQYEQAEQSLRKVIELEPEFVPAIWHLTRLVSRRSENSRSADERTLIQGEAERLVALMVEIAPASSYANGWLAAFAERRRDYQGAANYYEQSVAGGTDSNRWFQLSQCARYMTVLGRHDEAAELYEYVLSRDPACFSCLYSMARALRDSGRHREGAERLETILEWYPPSADIYWTLGASWLVAGEHEKALKYFDLQGQPHGENLGRLLALHSLGRLDEFDDEFALYYELNSDEPEGIARVYAWTGQNDLAFEWLDKIAERYGSDRVAETKTDLYDPIKSDPRWQAFLEKHGAEDRDLSWVEFNPELPAANWTPAEIRPANTT
jgi:TolB-like protein